MSAYCTKDDVKQHMSGDVPTMSTAFDGVITDLITELSDTIDDEVRQVRGQPDGWSFTPGAPTTRRYTGAAGGSNLILIDDAVAVSTVQLLDDTGSVLQTLALGSDYQVRPLNSLPITGLVRVNGLWPTSYGGVSVGMTPGYTSTTPTDIKLATINEVIRAYRGGLAGEDDRLGTEPFVPTQTMTKALLASTYRTIRRYRFGAAMLRTGN